MCFSWYKNHKLKVKLRWVEARERKKGIFCTVYFVRRKLVFYLNVLNTLSEYTYLYISKKNYFIHFYSLILKLPKAFSVFLRWNKISLQWYVLNRRDFPAFTEWVVLWYCFLNDLSVKNTSRLSEIRVYFKISSSLQI